MSDRALDRRVGVVGAGTIGSGIVRLLADLDATVEAGTITQDRADAIFDRLETWLNDGDIGNWGERGFGPMHRPLGPPVDDPAGETEGTSA